LLIENGYNVTCIDSLITGNKKLIPSEVNFFNFNISNKKKLTKLIKSNDFDLVMHFAGLIRVDESLKFPKKYMEFNYYKAKIFLETCFENNLKKIIFSSTASIYGNPKKNLVNETEKHNPLNPYAESKLNLEKFLIDSSKIFNSRYVILRYFNVAGADEKMRTGLISKFSTHLIKKIAEVVVGKDEKIIINGDDYNTKDGTTIRDYIHVSDLAEIHLISAKHLISNGKSDIYNCGYGVGYSVKEVVDTTNEILNKKIKYVFGPRRKGDSKMIVANSDKFKNKFSWKPKYNDLKYILKTAINWERDLLKKNFWINYHTIIMFLLYLV